MSEIVKGIFQLEIEHKALEAGLNEVAGAWRKVNKVQEDQNSELKKLMETEARLLEARSRSNNPTAIVQYNKKLLEVRASIDKVFFATKQATQQEKFMAIEANSLAASLSKAFQTTGVNSFKNSVADANRNLSNAGGLSSKLGSIIGGIGLLAIGKEIIQTTSTFDKFAAVLENTLGSKSLAQKALTQIKDFAATTPFSVEELTGSFVKLANQGFVPTQKEMRKLGDIAASQGKSFDQLTEAIIDGQTGEFERLKEFGIRASKEGDKVKFTFKGVETQTKFTSSAIRDYILSLGDAKGVSGSMAAISETLGGQISNLGDAWDNFLNTVGQNTKPIISGAIALLGQLLDSATRVVDQLGAVLSGNGGKRIDRDVISSFIVKGDGFDGANKSAKEFRDAMDGAKESAERLQKAGVDVGTAYSKSFEGAVKDFHDFDSAYQKLAGTITSSTSKKDGDNILSTFARTSRELKKENESGKLATSDYAVKVRLLGEAFNLAKDNQALYTRGGKATADASKKKADEYAKELAALHKLREELIKAQSDNRLVDIEDTLTGLDQVEAKFVELQTQQDHQFKERQIEIAKEFKFKNLQIDALAVLSQIQVAKDIKLNKERTKAILNEETKLLNEKLEASKTLADESLDIELNEGIKTELEVSAAKIDITRDYFDAKIGLLEKNIAAEQKAGIDTSEKQKQLLALRGKGIAEVSKAEDDFAKKLLAHSLAELEEAKRHGLEMLTLSRSHRLKFFEVEEQRRADDLKKELEYEEEKLKILRDSGEATELELRKQHNSNEELKKKADKAQKEADRVKIKGIVDGIIATVAASLAASNSIIQDAVNTKDQQINIQQQRINEARNLAERGNAELLEEEQKRLDDLNKAKARFVRAQQSLAAIELVANAGVAIAKAAAEGGVAAPFTIATTVIALIAGLAQARAIASQAAFYKGGLFDGQGYTGSGNPQDESMGVGRKPYKYHKQEFIFNHQTTNRYRDIFDDIHRGKIDLNEWRDKANSFDRFKRFESQTQAAILIPNGNNSEDILQLKGQLTQLVSAVKAQGMYINIDSEGFEVHLKNIRTKNDFVKNKLAKA